MLNSDIIKKRRHSRALTNLLPSPEELDKIGTKGLLALIHDAIGHLITPVNKLPGVMPVIEQVAETLIQQQVVLKEMLAARKDAGLDRFAARRLEEAPSLSHSVLKRDLRFVSVSESYCDLFEFSPTQFQSMSFNDLLHPADMPRFHKIVKLLLAGTVESAELVEWRATGTRRFVLTKDTLWGVRISQFGRPQYIATVSEKLASQDEAAMPVEGAKVRIR
ncbi:MAG: PAS domain-containing protein [Candidatus Binatus sp.]|uniref:PAS domain-containing protein n=1 Tax=Candidatus Binatus sp. TaxID=2811406 RepID=UPI003C76B481